MAIVDHQLTINNVKIELKLAMKLPPIHGNANQLQQVLMNFAINAQQAFDGNPGIVRITTEQRDDDKVLLVFADNGPGIPADIRVITSYSIHYTKLYECLRCLAGCQAKDQ